MQNKICLTSRSVCMQSLFSACTVCFSAAIALTLLVQRVYTIDIFGKSTSISVSAVILAPAFVSDQNIIQLYCPFLVNSCKLALAS